MTSMITQALTRCRRFFRRDEGALSVELVFVVPLLAGMTIGAVDFGLGFQESLRLESAARAGAQYAMLNSHGGEDPDAIKQAVRKDADDTANELNIAVAYFCTCLNGTPVDCATGSCAGGEVPLRFIDIDVTRDIDLLLKYPWFGDSFSIRGHTEMRVR